MIPGGAGATWPVTARPAPRFTPAPPRVPPGPEAGDVHWPGRWPLRTQLELAALETAPGSARAHVRAVLSEWRAGDDTAGTAALIVTELLTNAIETTWAHRRHDPVRLWMLGDTTSILFLVWDATMPAPVLAAPAPDDEYGRGLTLVTGLCEQWGYYHPAGHPHGKIVWALLRAVPAPGGAWPAAAGPRGEP